MKGRDELPGAVMCSKGTQVRTVTTFSFFSPGDCGVIPGEVGRKHVAGGGEGLRRERLRSCAGLVPSWALSVTCNSFIEV